MKMGSPRRWGGRGGRGGGIQGQTAHRAWVATDGEHCVQGERYLEGRTACRGKSTGENSSRRSTENEVNLIENSIVGDYCWLVQC